MTPVSAGSHRLHRNPGVGPALEEGSGTAAEPLTEVCPIQRRTVIIASPPRILTLTLASAEDLHPRRFRVFAEREVLAPWGTVRLHVIGESSLVVVDGGTVDVAEAITCGGCLPARAMASASISLTMGSEGRAGAGGLGFSYSGEVVAVSLAEDEAPLMEHVLEHRFPGRGAPLTRVEAEVRAGGLRIRTRHEYPEAGVAVLSRSELHLR
jgi:hypothetical protein